MNEGKLYANQQITLVTNHPKLLVGSGLEDLAPQQIGVFAKDGTSRFIATNTPVFAKNRQFMIAQGFRALEGPKRAQLPNWPHKTVPFKSSQITGWRGNKAKPYTKEQVVSIGYDGLDITKSISALKGQNIKVHLHLTGGPIHKLIPTDGWLHREYFIDGDCGTDVEVGTNAACRILQGRIIDAINADKFGNIPISNFVKATATSSCDETPAGVIASTVYQVTLVDDGSDLALGLVKAQYTNVAVTRVSQKDLFSTYQLVSSSAPAAVSLQQFAVLPNCSTCPSGYTLQALGQVFEVTVSSTETPADQTGQLSKTLLNRDERIAVYQYVMPSGTSYTTFSTGITSVLADAQVVNIGLQQALCLPPAATTMAWTSTSTTHQAPFTFQITLGDTICGTDRLAELQAAYPTLTITKDTVVGQANCVHRYSTTTYSTAVFDDTCSQNRYTPVAPDAFQGYIWQQAISTVTPASGCSCGIRLEGARFVSPVNTVTFPYIGYDKRDFDPVFIDVSGFSHDYQGQVCQNIPFVKTLLQNPDYPIGWGRDVIENELDSLGYFLKGPYSFHPILREVYGDTFIAKPETYYDEYQLDIATSHTNAAFFDQTGFNITYRFYFPAGQGKEFQDAINKLVESSNNPDLSEVVL